MLRSPIQRGDIDRVIRINELTASAGPGRSGTRLFWIVGVEGLSRHAKGGRP
jgi:hypothetical protein